MDRCISGLEQEQPVRRALDPESAEKIDAFIKLLLEKRTLKSTFTMVLLLKQTTGFLFAKHCLV
jgi:zinc finger protein